MTILFAIRCALIAVLLVVLAHEETVWGQSKKSKYACSEPNSAAICNAGKMCGSTSDPCTVDVKRTTNGASATPSIPGAKGNSTFCVTVGTPVVWKSETKHQGFVIDMGPTSPFDTDDIIGGSDKSVTVVAKRPGCYRFSAGVCISGELYGMCGNSNAEMIVK